MQHRFSELKAVVFARRQQHLCRKVGCTALPARPPHTEAACSTVASRHNRVSAVLHWEPLLPPLHVEPPSLVHSCMTLAGAVDDVADAMQSPLLRCELQSDCIGMVLLLLATGNVGCP